MLQDVAMLGFAKWKEWSATDQVATKIKILPAR